MKEKLPNRRTDESATIFEPKFNIEYNTTFLPNIKTSVKLELIANEAEMWPYFSINHIQVLI